MTPLPPERLEAIVSITRPSLAAGVFGLGIGGAFALLRGQPISFYSVGTGFNFVIGTNFLIDIELH